MFELDDFVDPRVLGIEWRGDDPVTEGLRLVGLRVYYGGVWNYQQRNAFTEESLSFVSLLGNYYFRRYQVGLALTGFEADDLAGTPEPFMEHFPGLQRGPGTSDYRVQLRVGRYHLSEADGEEQPLVSRLLAAWTVERPPGSELTHELTLEADVQIEDPGLIQRNRVIRGSFIYTWRINEGADDEHRLSYLYRAVHWERARFKLRGRIGLGAERTFGHWRWGTVRWELSLDVQLPKVGSILHLVAGPARRFQSRGVEGESNLELAVFLDSRIFSRLF